jgi:integrase
MRPRCDQTTGPSEPRPEGQAQLTRGPDPTSAALRRMKAAAAQEPPRPTAPAAPTDTAGRRERPTRRKNPSGGTVWVARYTNPRTGKRELAKPSWNDNKATFTRRRDAQRAIDEAYERRPVVRPILTLGEYAAVWINRHPRSVRTNDTNADRLARVLGIELEGLPLRDWPYDKLRRRHAVELVDVLLRVQGRARLGALGLVRTLSAMTEDAIADEVAEINAFKGVQIRSNDPRIRKNARAPRVFTIAELHEFTACGHAIVSLDPKTGKPRPRVKPRNYEALLRTFTDTGARLGEILALERRQLVDGVFHFEGTAHNGVVSRDTRTKRHTRLVPATDELLELIKAMPPRIDTPLLFPAPRGRMWGERAFYRDVWVPARELWGRDITPHDCRHSFVTNLAAAGIDEADLAEMAGHGVDTMRRIYRHPLRRSFDVVREIYRRSA